MNTRQLQAVMIDLDGTMVDTLGDFEVALNRALTDLKVPTASRALIERSIGKGSEHLIRAVLGHQLAQPGMPVDAREVEALFNPRVDPLRTPLPGYQRRVFSSFSGRDGGSGTAQGHGPAFGLPDQ